MALNRLEIGTKCVVRSTGESGTIKQIYFYPTKYELEFSDGRIVVLRGAFKDINTIRFHTDYRSDKIKIFLQIYSFWRHKIYKEYNFLNSFYK